MVSFIKNYFYPVLSDAQIQQNNFQDAIKRGNGEGVRKNIYSINDPLPNGEHPLHFAVQYGQGSAVAELLSAGANPGIQDGKGLSAFDHASLSGNTKLFAKLLGPQFQNDVDAAQTELQSGLGESALIQIQAFQKSVLESTALASPLMVAVLSKDASQVKEQLAAGTSLVNPLEIAAAILSSSLEVVQLLVDSKVDIVLPDSQGRSPLHYAAANPDERVFAWLLQRSSRESLLAKDLSGVSPIAILGAAASQRDPLQLSKAHVFMSLCCGVVCALQYADPGVISPDMSLLLLKLLDWSEFSLFLSTLDKDNWKQRTVAWVCQLYLLQAIPVASLPFMVWKVKNIAKACFDGLRASWNHQVARPGKALLNTVVYGITGFSTFINVMRTWENYEHRRYEEKRKQQEESWNKKFREEHFQSEGWKKFEEQQRARENYHRSHGQPREQQLKPCDPLPVQALQGLSSEKRLLNEQFKPKECLVHAVQMIKVDASLACTDQKLLNRMYKKLSLELHPDHSQSPTAHEAFTRLGAAKDRIDLDMKKRCGDQWRSKGPQATRED